VRRPRRALVWTAGTFRQPPTPMSAMLNTSRTLDRTHAVLCLPLVSLLLGPSDLSLKVLSLDINLAQSTGQQFVHVMSTGKTHFSVVSFKSFSALSSSSSKSWTFRAKFSPVVLWVSPSAEADLSSLILSSDFSTSASARASLCWSEETSWSRSSRVWLSYLSE